MNRSVAIAHPNIALVKYWGKRDLALNLPAVPSLSLTLNGFQTTTEVSWGAARDEVVLNGERVSGQVADKVTRFLDRVDANRPPVRVVSQNNFPSAAGLASSSSAFAALALAATHAAGQERSRRELSALARQGSGSACRSLFGGFAVWDLGVRADGSDCVARPLADQHHWDVSMVVAVVSSAKKAIGSTEGMERSRRTSAFYDAWVATAARDLEQAEQAVLSRDLATLGRVMEASTNKMHAVMHASEPTIRYWKPATLACLDAVAALRADGIPAFATMDAGPNVKVLCASSHASQVVAALAPHVDNTRVLGPGGPATVETI